MPATRCRGVVRLSVERMKGALVPGSHVQGSCSSDNRGAATRSWREEVPGRWDSHPHLGVVCPHGPALVGQWELVWRRRALLLELRIPVARGQCPDAPDDVDREAGDASYAPLERGGRCTASAPEAAVRRARDQRDQWGSNPQPSGRQPDALPVEPWPQRGPSPERRRQRCARAVGVACLPTRAPCLAVRRRTTVVLVLQYCFPSPDHRLSNSGRRARRRRVLRGSAAASLTGGETQNAPPGTRRRWGVWYRSRIRGGSAYATAYALPTRFLHPSLALAAGDSPPRASFRTDLASCTRRDHHRRFGSRPGARSSSARQRARSSPRRRGRSPRAVRRRGGERSVPSSNRISVNCRLLVGEIAETQNRAADDRPRALLRFGVDRSAGA